MRDIHPLPVGTRVKTLGGAAQGDWDDGENDDGSYSRRDTAPGEWGRITSARMGSAGDMIYGVEFDDSHVWIFLEEEEIEDATKYELAPPSPLSTT